MCSHWRDISIPNYRRRVWRSPISRSPLKWIMTRLEISIKNTPKAHNKSLYDLKMSDISRIEDKHVSSFV